MTFTRRAATFIIALSALAGFLTGWAAASGPLPATGNDLVNDIELCEEADVTPADSANWRACYGYLTGIIVGATATANAQGSALSFCLPADTNDKSLRTALLGHLKSDEILAAEPAHLAVLSAMSTIYPCE